MLRKFQPNFKHYVVKIEAQPKSGFLIKKMFTVRKYELRM